MAKGVIKHPTIHEKYQRVFDKYTLDKQEFAELKIKRKEEQKNKTLNRLNSVYDENDSPIIF
jgi:hypothetical protein